jgi:energy-coupling factor transport system permease protein
MRPFRYVEQRSFLHSLNPSVKLLAVVLVTIAITFVLDVATPLVFLAASLLATWLLGRLPLGYVLRSLTPFILLALSFVLFNTLFHRELATETVIFTLGPLTVTWEGLAIGLSIGLRVLFIASTSLLFISTTKPGDFVLSLVQQAHINYKLAFAILSAYRFVPVLATEYANIRAAGQVRGLGARSGPISNLKALRRDAIPLLAGAIRRSERMAVAMDSRAFGAHDTRTYHRTLTVTRRDWLFLLGVIAVSAALFAILGYTGLISGVGAQLDQPNP